MQPASANSASLTATPQTYENVEVDERERSILDRSYAAALAASRQSVASSLTSATRRRAASGGNACATSYSAVAVGAIPHQHTVVPTSGDGSTATLKLGMMANKPWVCFMLASPPLLLNVFDFCRARGQEREASGWQQSENRRNCWLFLLFCWNLLQSLFWSVLHLGGKAVLDGTFPRLPTVGIADFYVRTGERHQMTISSQPRTAVTLSHCYWKVQHIVAQRICTSGLSFLWKLESSRPPLERTSSSLLENGRPKKVHLEEHFSIREWKMLRIEGWGPVFSFIYLVDGYYMISEVEM